MPVPPASILLCPRTTVTATGIPLLTVMILSWARLFRPSASIVGAAALAPAGNVAALVLADDPAPTPGALPTVAASATVPYP